MSDSIHFEDELAVVDGLVVIRDGKLTPEAQHSPYMRLYAEVKADRDARRKSSMKPVNAFLKEVKRLEARARELTWPQDDTDHVWPFAHDHEANPEDCFKREDGLWELNERINTHIQRGSSLPGSRVVFIWRTHPNYCTAGRPCYTSEQMATYMRESETEKVLVSEGGYEYVWRWDTFKGPTEVVWGMQMGPTFFELRKDGKEVLRADTKAAFKRAVEAHFHV